MSTVVIDNTRPIFPSGTLLAIQRTGSTTAAAITGTFTGTTPTSLEANSGSGWQACTGFSTGTGTFAATLPAYAAADYASLQVRMGNETATVSTATRMSIGDFFPVWTDSTGGTGVAYNPGITTGVPCWAWYVTDTEWLNLLNNGGSNYWPYLAQQMRAYLGYPVFFHIYFSSGATLQGTTNGWNATAGTNYPLAIGHITTSKLIGGAKAVLLCVGSNDIQPSHAITGYQSDLATTKAAIVANLGNSLSLLTTIIPDKGNTSWAGDLVDYRLRMDNQRQAVLDAYAAGDALRGANLTGQLYPSDHTHPETTQNGKDIAYRFYAALRREVYGDTTIPRSPQRSSVTIDAANTTIRVTFDQPLSNAISSTVAGFRVMDNGTSVTITSQTVTSAQVVTLVLAAAIVGTCTVSFASSEDAVGQTIPLGVAIVLPDTSVDSSFSLPAEPFFSVSTTPYVATGVSRSRQQLCM